MIFRRKKGNSSSDHKDEQELYKELAEGQISYDNIDLELDGIGEPDTKRNESKKSSKEPREEKQRIELDTSGLQAGNRDSIQEVCSQVADAKKQVAEAKLEYKAVTDYLADIQKIDRIPPKDRETLDDAARNIITLTRERSKYQTTDVKLSDVQFRNIGRYEKEMMRELKQMRENEDYQRKVKGDLRQLAAEKAKLQYEQEELVNSQELLKKLAIFAGSLIVLMDIIFLLVSNSNELNLKVPFILSIVLGAGIGFYIFMESRKNREEIVMNSKKRNKLVGITNKVKVKYVNTQNALDYAYEKFMVSNSVELDQVYQKYMKAKQEAEKYRSNTGMLNHYNMVLVNELEQYHLKDSDIWIYQAAALIDNREMVEIRHRLNERRQKLRERIDFNYDVQKKGLEALKTVMEKKPDMQRQIRMEMEQYHIEFEES